VFERIREFGVLKALGMGPGKVLRLILMESMYLTGLATVAGCTLSILPLWYMARVGLDLSSLGDLTIQGLAWDPIWTVKVDASIFTQPISIMVTIVLIGTLYPAIKAALIRPVSAMQHR
jgi:ABC-type antimicrobial peptide transport system permease subunit